MSWFIFYHFGEGANVRDEMQKNFPILHSSLSIPFGIRVFNSSIICWSYPLNLDYTCNLIWPRECGKIDAVSFLSIDLKTYAVTLDQQQQLTIKWSQTHEQADLTTAEPDPDQPNCPADPWSHEPQ